MYIISQSGNIKETIGCVSLEFTGETRSNDMNLDITGKEIKFNMKALFKITWKGSVELKGCAELESWALQI